MKISDILEGVTKAEASHHNESWEDDEMIEVHAAVEKHGKEMSTDQIDHEGDILSHKFGRRTQGSYVAALIRLYCTIYGTIPKGTIKNQNWFKEKGAQKTIAYAKSIGIQNAQENYRRATIAFTLHKEERKEATAAAADSRIQGQAKKDALNKWEKQFHISSVGIPQELHGFIEDSKGAMIKEIMNGKPPRQVFVNWVAKRGGVMESTKGLKFRDFLTR